MKRILSYAAFLLLAVATSYVTATITRPAYTSAQSGMSGGVTGFGIAGRCAQWATTNSLTAAAAACGGGGGLTCTATAGQVLYSPAGTDCGGVPGSIADTNGAVAFSPSGTGVALTLTGDANGSDIQQINSNGGSGGNVYEMFADGLIALTQVGGDDALDISTAGGLGVSVTAQDVNGAGDGNYGIGVQWIENDSTGSGATGVGVRYRCWMTGSNIGTDACHAAQYGWQVLESIGNASEVSAIYVEAGANAGAGTIGAIAGMEVENQCVGNFTTCDAVEIDNQGSSNFALTTGTGQVSFGDRIVQANANEFAGTVSVSSATSGSQNFAVAFANAPACTITPITDPTTVGVWWVTTSTTAVTANVKVSGTITFNYVCIGNPN